MNLLPNDVQLIVHRLLHRNMLTMLHFELNYRIMKYSRWYVYDRMYFISVGYNQSGNYIHREPRSIRHIFKAPILNLNMKIQYMSK